MADAPAARIESIDAEAEALICDLGAAAYSEARRRGYEASSDAIAEDWDRVALAVARKTAGPAPAGGKDPTGNQASPLAQMRPASTEGGDPDHVLDRRPQTFRIQYVGGAP